VVVDNRSNDSAAEPAAVGETPLLAARLMNLASPGAVVISGSMRRLLGRLFDYRQVPDAELQEAAEPVAACQVLSESGIASRFEALRSRRTRLIGREEEVELLRRRWTQVKETGQGRVVLVSGEPGIGKSRLAATLEDTIETEPHACLRYFCSPHHTQSALHPVIAQLERAALIEREDSADVRLDKLEALLAPFCESLSQDVPLFALLLSIPGGERYLLPSVTPQLIKERTMRALLTRLKHVAARQPVLMVFEDLHWIDPTSLELLSLVIDQMKGQRVLLLATARPEFTPPWPSHRHISSVALSRLDRSEVGAVAAGITGGKTLPNDILDQIFARTDGVPLFIEELTTSLLETGLLRETANHYVLEGPLPLLAIPSTLHASLLARLDRLGMVKDVVQMGAAIGREFRYELLAAVASLTRADLDAALERLTASGLISRRGTPPHATYTFKHALVQDAAYQSLVRSTRQQYHLRIADALEQQFPERAQSEPEVAAYHCAEAGMNNRAVRYLRQAGLRAMARAANREATTHLEQALGALRRLPETRETTELTIDIRVDLRNALNPLGEWARMGEHLYEAEALAKRLGDQHRLGRIDTFMLIQCLVTGDYDEAVRFGQEALNIGRTLGDRAIEVVATTYLGQTHAARGEFSDAVSLLERNVALEGDLRYERFGAPVIQSVRSGADLADVLSQLGRFDQAIGHAEAAVRIAEAADHPFTLFFALFDLGRAHLRRGDLPRATRVLERSLDLCRTWQLVGGTPFVAAALGAAHALAGRVDEALPLVASAVDEFSSRQIQQWPAFILLCAGMTYLSAGKIDEASSHARAALALTRRLGARGSEAHTLCLAGDVASIGSTGDAEGYYRKALALAETLGLRPLVAHCHLGLGKLYRRAGKRDEARQHLITATTTYREMDMRFWLEKAGSEIKALH
ncbi:MAG TPA: tetratricopeptide repeat protein, partial [Gemmatimonadales bacterium]|nr:tetratricopeptide repeat protein [Gemmatimonadales bacterium]